MGLSIEVGEEVDILTMRREPATLGRSMNRSIFGSFVRKAKDAPTSPGAYVLLIELPESVEVTLPGKPKNCPSGWALSLLRLGQGIRRYSRAPGAAHAT